MAQSDKELNIGLASKARNRSVTNMNDPKEEILEIDPVEAFAWDVDSIDAALKQLDVTVSTT